MLQHYALEENIPYHASLDKCVHACVYVCIRTDTHTCNMYM